jgi:addiction module HigA family antidote
MRMHNPPHPGRIIKEFLEGHPLTVAQFAKHIGVARGTLSRIINQRAGITPEISIRLSQAFGQPTSDIWFMMQSDYDFWQAEHSRKRKKIAPIAKPKFDIAA